MRKAVQLLSMSIIQNEQINLFIHLKWMISSKSLVTTLNSVLLTVLYLITVLSLPNKSLNNFSRRCEKKRTTWLAAFWKGEKLREHHFLFEISRSWVNKFFFEFEAATNNWIIKVCQNFWSFLNGFVRTSLGRLEKFSE